MTPAHNKALSITEGLGTRGIFNLRWVEWLSCHAVTFVLRACAP